jgi:hypothetical protein
VDGCDDAKCDIVVAVMALVALAGCTGFAPGATPGTTPTDDAPETDEPSGATDETGELTFPIPDGAEEIEVEVESGDAEAELEVELEETPPA